MVKTDRDIYIYETEIRPNRYSRLVLMFCLGVISSCWILNEIGIFRVGKEDMRIGAIVTIISLAVPYIILLVNKNACSDKRTKYLVVIAGCLFTFATGTMMTFHSTIMLILPIFLAMLYRSKAVGFVAAIGSCFSAVFAPILGYLLGTWDIDFLRELISIGTNGTAVIEGAYEGVTAKGIIEILLYMAFPRVLMLVACSVLMFRVIRLGNDHVNNQILLSRLSRIDALTGLYNQNCYQEILSTAKGDTQIGIVFFDVNELKKLNDSKGHEIGDVMIQRCASSVLSVCNGTNINAFRVGGDEFVMLVEDADEQLVQAKLCEWEAALEQINRDNESNTEIPACSMAHGWVLGKAGDMEKLIQKADELMYINKNALKTAGN